MNGRKQTRKQVEKISINFKFFQDQLTHPIKQPRRKRKKFTLHLQTFIYYMHINVDMSNYSALRRAHTK